LVGRYQIKLAEAYTPKIKMALTQTRLIIEILFKNWAQNDWCQREVERSGRIHIDTCDLIITAIFKNKLKRECLRLLTQSHQAREGYRFFTSDTTGKTHQLCWHEHHEHEEIHGSNVSDWILVAAAQTDDEKLTVTLTILVQGYGLSMQPYFPQDYSSLALNQPILRFLWGAAKGTDLQLPLYKLTLSAQTIFLSLPGGNETTERRFYQKSILLKIIDTLPNNWPENRKLQVSLDMLPRTGDES